MRGKDLIFGVVFDVWCGVCLWCLKMMMRRFPRELERVYVWSQLLSRTL